MSNPTVQPVSFKIREQLRVMHRQERFDRLEFNDHLFFDNEIEPVSAIEFDAAIFDRQRFLTLEFQTSQ